MDMLIVGCGYLGQRVAVHYLGLGRAVCGLVKSSSSARRLAELGITPVRGDLDDSMLPALPLRGCELFYFAPPPKEGVEEPRVEHLISAFRSQGQPRRLIYVSTTGVYGDCAGAWVDERHPVAPGADRARRRLDAERRLLAWRLESDAELVILRVAGIYGPGRLPLDRLRQGLPLVREEEAPWSNRIHIEDLVQICIAAMRQGGDGEVYNVSDGHPSTMTDYFNRVADLAGLPRPPLITMAQGEAQLSLGMRGYMQESRRLCNDKVLRELAVSLRYPDLDRGLAACFADNAGHPRPAG